MLTNPSPQVHPGLSVFFIIQILRITWIILGGSARVPYVENLPLPLNTFFGPDLDPDQHHFPDAKGGILAKIKRIDLDGR